MNGTMHKWLLKSLGSLSLASTVVLLPMLLTGCGEDSSGTSVPVPPPPPPAPPAPPPAPPAPTPTPTPAGRVIGISPADGSTNVPINTRIVIRFSEPVREAPLTQALSITSVAPQAGAVPARDITFNSDRTEVTITFRTPLSNDSVYRVTISRSVPDLFASGRSLAEDFVATFTTGNVAVSGDPISLLPTQLAAIARNGQVFSNPTAIPVGYGIRRGGAAENLPVGTYDDYRAVLSFPIPASIPANAVVQEAQLTLVQLPSSDSVTIPDFGNVGRGFFFFDPTPHNLPANNVVFQEVTLGAPNNVVSSDFFAPASTPSFIALSINGNVLGKDVSAGPRTADVRSGVQRAVSGSRFYQVRLQCAREVWNNQATASFPTVIVTLSQIGQDIAVATYFLAQRGGGVAEITGFGSATASTQGNDTVSISLNTYSVSLDFAATATVTLFADSTSGVAIVSGSTFSFIAPAFSSTLSLTRSFGGLGFTETFSFIGNVVNATGSVSVSVQGIDDTTITFAATIVDASRVTLTVPFTYSFAATATTNGTPANAAGLEISQGAGGTCRAEFDKEPAGGTGTQPLTTARGPRLDIRFTIPR